MDKKQIGIRILGLRRESGLLQHELAQKLGIDRTTLSKVETGENAPTVAILIKLKRLFTISIDWLLTGIGPKENLEPQDKEIKQLLIDMKRDPYFKHYILSEYFRFKLRNPELFGLKKKSKKKREVKSERRGN